MNSTSPDTIYFTNPSDPFLQTPWKIGTVSFIVTLLILVWVLVGLAAWNRNYPPIKSKGILLIMAMIIGDTTAVIGELYITQIVDLTGNFLTSSGYGCSFLFWFPGLFSLGSVNIQNYRMYRLHYIVNLRLPIHTFSFWLPFIIFNIPYIIFSLLLISPSNQFVTRTPLNNPFEYGCDYVKPYIQKEWIASLDAIANLIVYLFGLYIAIQLRRLSASLNESKEMINIYSSLFIGYIILIVNTVSLLSDTTPEGKIYNVIFFTILPLRLCAILVKPVWNCYFKNAEYLREWKAGLKNPKKENARALPNHKIGNAGIGDDVELKKEGGLKGVDHVKEGMGTKTEMMSDGAPT